jgi:type III restriction enzyme
MSNRKLAYQSYAIDDLSTDIAYHLDRPARNGGLKSPTGSGKTYMTSGIVKEVSKRLNGDVAFIFLTIGSGDLPKQAQGALSSNLRSSGVRVYDVKSSVSCTAGLRNCVVVAGWESLNRHDKKNDNKRSNIVMKEGDGLSFPELCELTHNANTPIVLIIDEDHIASGTSISKELIELIGPSYILRVSATLKTQVDHRCVISYAEVAKSGMVKDSIHVTTFPVYQQGIRMGVDKINHLNAIAQGVGAKCVFKLLAFIPNDGNSSVELDDILNLLRTEYEMTEESGDVKVVLSKRKTKGWELCKGAEGNEDKTKVIITKEAIGTGVDIPSISVIVQLRPTDTKTAYLQKVGRGLRMPEKKHYEDASELNTLYYFVDEALKLDFADVEDLESRQLFVSYRRDSFNDTVAAFVPLPGSFYDRQELLAETDTSVFEVIFRPLFLAKLQAKGIAGFNKWTRDLEYHIYYKEYKYDEEKSVDLGEIDMDANNHDVGLLYERKMRDVLKHLWKHQSVINDAVFEFMQSVVTDGLPVGQEYVMTFIVHNLDVLLPLIKEALEDSEVAYDKARVGHTFDYVPPEKYEFIRDPKETVEKKTAKCLYAPYYEDSGAKRSNTEDDCADHLDKHPNVLWWAKNYDRKYGDSYSTTYVGKDKGRDTDKAFFPDFVGQLTDGRTFVLEVKEGDLDHEVDNKRDALVTAIGNVTICGIVRRYTGCWYVETEDGNKVQLDDIFAIPAKVK